MISALNLQRPDFFAFPQNFAVEFETSLPYLHSAGSDLSIFSLDHS